MTEDVALIQEAEHQSFSVSQRTLRGLDYIDSTSPELRQLCHDYGTEMVQLFTNRGFTNPKEIAELINAVQVGPRSDSQRKSGNRNKQSPITTTIDNLLLQAGANINAMQFARVLFQNGFSIVPIAGTSGDVMIKASMETVSKHSMFVTKREKHRLRLVAAMTAAAERL